jgi:hypothetical protein
LREGEEAGIEKEEEGAIAIYYINKEDYECTRKETIRTTRRV